MHPVTAGGISICWNQKWKNSDGPELNLVLASMVGEGGDRIWPTYSRSPPNSWNGQVIWLSSSSFTPQHHKSWHSPQRSIDCSDHVDKRLRCRAFRQAVLTTPHPQGHSPMPTSLCSLAPTRMIRLCAVRNSTQHEVDGACLSWSRLRMKKMALAYIPLPSWWASQQIKITGNCKVQ